MHRLILILLLFVLTASQLPAAPIAWEKNVQRAFAHASEIKRPTAVYFTAAWCPHCQKFERNTLTQPEVQAALGNFVLVKVDIDRELAFAQQQQVTSIPRWQVFDSDGEMAYEISYWEDESSFLGKISENERRRVAQLPTDTGEIGFQFPNWDASSELVTTPDGYRGRGICFSQVGYGPLRLRSQSPFQALRTGLVPRAPSTMAKGQWEFLANSTWVNIWANGQEAFSLDYETLSASATLSYGIADDLEVEFQYLERSRFSGGMDGFIQGFHDAVGLGQDGRTNVSKDRFHMYLAPRGGQPGVYLNDSNRGTFSRSGLIALQHNVSCGTSTLPAFSYAVSIRHNFSQEDIMDGDDWDAGLSVSLARRFNRVYAYLSLGMAYLGEETFRGISLETTQFSALLAAEWNFAPRWAGIIQYLASEGVAKDWQAFSEYSHEITLGLKWEFFSRTVAELGLIENLFITENSPDFGISMGIVHRL